jgi:hypothetical protein
MRILYVHGWYIKQPMHLLFIWCGTKWFRHHINNRYINSYSSSSGPKIRDPGWKKSGSGIRDKYLESATLIIMGVIPSNMAIFVRQTEGYFTSIA